MNAPLRISSPGGDQELEKKFVEEAAAQNMIQLKGHRSVQCSQNKNESIQQNIIVKILPKRQYSNNPRITT